MKYYSAWAEITGRVFVGDFEIAAELGCKDDELHLQDEKKVRAVFRDLAIEKLADRFLTDDPLKLNEVIVDDPDF